MKLFYLIFIYLAMVTAVSAQDTHVISGVVKARNGGVLPGAGIYVSGYKLGTAANDKGEFSLPPLRNGNYELLVQMIGYAPQSQKVTISGSPLRVEVVLEENATTLNEVIIRPDPDRLNHLRIFRECFIGLSENAAECRILNQNVLRTQFDNETRVLHVSADDLLIIENKALGYRIKYLLKEFEFDMRSKIVFYAGLPTFEDLPVSQARLRRYQKKRVTAYLGSTQHFFRALFAGTTVAEGFLIHQLVSKRNLERLPDSIIDANIKRLAAKRDAAESLLLASNDSLAFWSRMKRQPERINILDRRPIGLDTLVHTYNKDLKYVRNLQPLYVIYTKERESDAFRSRIGMSLNRPPDVPDYQISLVNLLAPRLLFYGNGEVAEARSVLYEGYWAWEKIAESLPMNYELPRDP